MITLNESLLIGKGRDRACYQHPKLSNICIKVAIKPEKQSLREIRYLKYLSKKNKDLRFLCKFHGNIKTNLGNGYMFELVNDDDGNVAHNLTYIISKGLIEINQVKKIINQLTSYLYTESICAYDLSLNNLVAYQDKHNLWKVKLVDGFGISGPNQLPTRFNWLTKKILDHSVKSLEKEIQSDFERIKSTLF